MQRLYYVEQKQIGESSQYSTNVMCVSVIKETPHAYVVPISANIKLPSTDASINKNFILKKSVKVNKKTLIGKIKSNTGRQYFRSLDSAKSYAVKRYYSV